MKRSIITPDLRSNRVTTTLIVLVIFFVASAGAREWYRGRTFSHSPVNTGVNSQFGAELVTLRRFGFEPAEITRPRGSFVLEVDNRAEVISVDLRIERVGNGRVCAVHVPHEKLDWIDILPDLPAGEYLLTELSHPDWVCRITLTQQ